MVVDGISDTTAVDAALTQLWRVVDRDVGARMVRIVVGAFAASALVLAASQGAVAGDAKAGRQKALQCQTCHGLDGMAKLPEAPNLAGQSEAYLVKALKDFRAGERKNDMMSLVIANLKDADIADLAAYYAGIPVTVGTPPKVQ
jgi:cytochrome c553